MKRLILFVFLGAFASLRADAQSVIYNNDFPNDLIGTASRPEGNGKIEIESAEGDASSPRLDPEPLNRRIWSGNRYRLGSVDRADFKRAAHFGQQLARCLAA